MVRKTKIELKTKQKNPHKNNQTKSPNPNKIQKNNLTFTPNPIPPSSTSQLFYLPLRQAAQEDEEWGLWSVHITVPLCLSFLLTLFPCFSMGTCTGCSVDICSDMIIQRLQGDNLPHCSPLHGLWGNPCSSAWSISSLPFFIDLSACRAVIF